MKNNIKINEILTRIKYAMNLKTWKDVAAYLKEEPATLSAWRSRNSKLPIEKILYRAMEDINEEFLLTGEGPALRQKPPLTKMEYPEKSAAEDLRAEGRKLNRQVKEACPHGQNQEGNQSQ